VEDQQVGDQVIVLDDFQLLIPYVFLNTVSGEVDPLGELVKAFAPIRRAVDYAPQFFAIYVFQKEAGTDDPAKFPKCVIQFVFSAGGTELTQDRRRCNSASLDRQRNL